MSTELGVSSTLLYRWAREFSNEQAQDERSSNEDLASENRRLRREVKCFKKCFEILRLSAIDWYRIVGRWRGHYPIAFMCPLLRIARSKYYAWVDRGQETSRARSDRRLLVPIRRLFHEESEDYSAYHRQGKCFDEVLNYDQSSVLLFVFINEFHNACCE